jgi:hypothetical protein
MSENSKNERSNERRLPPPAFPPGMRRHVYRSATGAKREQQRQEDADAFISPDDPLPPRKDSMGGAFISPDDPLPQRRVDLAEGFSDLQPIDPDEEGVVVGMDLDPHMEEASGVPRGDPYVMEAMEALEKLAEALRRRGEAGLRWSPEMSRFEATLRAYCVGYLAGRRAEGPPPPEIDEALPTDG